MTAAKFERYTRLMLAGAAAILVVTAARHGAGFAEIDRLVMHAEMPEAWRNAVRMVWIVYPAHLLLVAAILIYAASRTHAVPGPLLMLCGLIPSVDAVILLIYGGGYIGTLLLGFAAVLVFGAVARGTMHWHDGSIGGGAAGPGASRHSP